MLIVEISNKMIQILTEKGYEFHSFKAKDEPSKCFILRGLNGVRNAEAIRDAFMEAGFPENTDVIPHITGFQKSNPELKHNTLLSGGYIKQIGRENHGRD